MDDHLTWKCDDCGKQAAWLDLPHAELHRCLSTWKASRAEDWEHEHAGDHGWFFHDAASFLEMLETRWPKASWRVRCQEHAIDDCAYSIEISRISTLREMLTWTHHLLGKEDWLTVTDWDDLIARHVYPEMKISGRPARPARQDLVTICYLCHRPLADPVEQDHVLPVSKGGYYGLTMPVHKACNRQKRDKPWFTVA